MPCNVPHKSRQTSEHYMYGFQCQSPPTQLNPHTMAPASPSAVSIQHVSIPSALSTFVDSFQQLPDSPASLYLTVDAKKLVIYVAPAATVNIIILQDLKAGLNQSDAGALALKSFL